MLGKSGVCAQFGESTAGPGQGIPMTGAHDEFALIDALRARFGASGPGLAPGDLGIGDDAAAVTLPGPGRVVLATDLVVEGVHVDRATATPEDIGWKALMATVSDVGAMGCAPSHALLSVAAPEGFPVERLADGVAEAAATVGCAVVGGDLSASALLVVSVTAVGPADDADVPLLRAWRRSTGGPPLRHRPARWVGRRPPADCRRRVGRQEGPGARRAGLGPSSPGGPDPGGDGGPGRRGLRVHRRVRRTDGRRHPSGRGVGRRPRPGGGGRGRGVGRHPRRRPRRGRGLRAGGGHPGPGRPVAPRSGRAGLRPLLAIGSCVDRSAGRMLDGGPLPAGGWRHRF